MKLSEIYEQSDDNPFLDWMYDGNILNPHTGKPITADTDEDDIGDQVHYVDNGVYISNYTGDANFVFNASRQLHPTMPLDAVDLLAFGYGSYKNITNCWPIHASEEVEFTHVSDIDINDLVNRLKDVNDLRINFSGCGFIGSLANLIELPVTDPDNFFITDNTPNVGELLELFHRGFDEHMDVFEFQDLLIDNGFENLV